MEVELEMEKGVLRIRDKHPGSDSFHPGSRVEKIPGSDPN
jgi:hypothetical protein